MIYLPKEEDNLLTFLKKQIKHSVVHMKEFQAKMIEIKVNSKTK